MLCTRWAGKVGEAGARDLSRLAGAQNHAQLELAVGRIVAQIVGLNGAPGEIRTPDLLIRSQILATLQDAASNRIDLYKSFIFIT